MALAAIGPKPRTSEIILPQSGVGWRQAEAEEAQHCDGDRHIAEPQAGIDDEGPARIEADSTSMM